MTLDVHTIFQEYGLGTNPTVPNSFPGGGLVINELDYDNVGTDLQEFVEILNTSTNPIPLANLALVFLNGSAIPRSRVPAHQPRSLTPANTLSGREG